MTLSTERALSVIRKAIDAGAAQKCPIVAVVTDPAGAIVAMARMDGVHAVNIEVARKKALTAAAFAQPTHDFVDAIQRDPLAKTVVMNDPNLNVLPGGIPIKDGEVVVGALGVAGGYYLQDRAIAEFAAQDA
jgi:uncharacterized protein GlcG (DUF336 family)